MLELAKLDDEARDKHKKKSAARSSHGYSIGDFVDIVNEPQWYLYSVDRECVNRTGNGCSFERHWSSALPTEVSWPQVGPPLYARDLAYVISSRVLVFSFISFEKALLRSSGCQVHQLRSIPKRSHVTVNDFAKDGMGADLYVPSLGIRRNVAWSSFRPADSALSALLQIDTSTLNFPWNDMIVDVEPRRGFDFFSSCRSRPHKCYHATRNGETQFRRPRPPEE